ncbi:MAG TPA: hypothetical protein VIR63_00980 [Pontiella sp.]
MRAPSGTDGEEYYIAEIEGIQFFQRVRKINAFGDRSVELTWKIVNTTGSPYWYELKESPASPGVKSYEWGGGTIQPGATKKTDLWGGMSYPEGTANWNFEASVRRK